MSTRISSFVHSQTASSTGAPQSSVSYGAKALIAITLDIEMSRNFPTWEQTHWDYEKGNLDSDTKRYTVRVAQRVKERGGQVNFFALGQTFEQPDLDWLRGIINQGHKVGNHTYDHINVKATSSQNLQFLYGRAPWLVYGRSAREVIADNIRMTSMAFQERLRIHPVGLRTPGGFPNALDDRPDLQDLFLSLGFTWVSAKYPAHIMNKTAQAPSEDVIQSILKAQEAAQPYVYPSGLIEISRSPISDINAFRNGRWPLETFLKTIQMGVRWAIQHSAVFVFLGHPSCLLVTDPEMQVFDLICNLVSETNGKAAIVDLETVAQRARETRRI